MRSTVVGNHSRGTLVSMDPHIKRHNIKEEAGGVLVVGAEVIKVSSRMALKRTQMVHHKRKIRRQMTRSMVLLPLPILQPLTLPRLLPPSCHLQMPLKLH